MQTFAPRAVRVLLVLVAAGACSVEARAQAAPMTLTLDASDAPRRILEGKLVIPAKPGPLTLYYPKWIPGEHGPTGPITDVAGLRITANGKGIPWRRDDVDMYAIHCKVPQGADAVEVSLNFLSPPGGTGFSSAASCTPHLAMLNWNQVLLYPGGRPVREIQCRASLRLPAGWKFGTALPVRKQEGQLVEFEPVSLETLVDSPVVCGAHFRDVPIGPKGGPHSVALACDSAAGLEMSPAMKADLDRLIVEGEKLFGSRPYRSYKFLVALSDHVAHFGLEHHESSDNRMSERILLDDRMRKNWWAMLLPHEYVHSWNGKYRRPADMVTDTFQQAQRTRLLWVYEGLTQYLGVVLTARCGLWTPEQFRDYVAWAAEWAGNQRGRAWRPLDDTAAAAQLLFYARGDWASWRRGVDFYDEGLLLWLDIDTLIREKTQGKKSLDDFCRRFHGGESGPPQVKTFTLEDVVADLNAVVAHDWKGLLQKRVASPAKEPPLDGITRGGWKLTYGEKQTDLHEANDGEAKLIDLAASVGLVLKEDGTVADVVPGKSAHKAGVGPGMKLIAVNSRRYTAAL